MRNIIEKMPWLMTILLVFTLGLTPYVPQPHIWEKLIMLSSGKLTQPLDIFDLLLHSMLWLLLASKAWLHIKKGTFTDPV